VKHRPPVWITGVGAVSPLGNGFEKIAKSLLAGRSGIRYVQGFDVANHPCQIGAQLDTIPCPAGWEKKRFASLDRIEQLVLSCTTLALENSGWWEQRASLRVGLVLGVGAEWPIRWEEDYWRGGQRLFSPTFDTESLVESTRRHLGITGPVASVSAACASGNYALSQARQWIELGWVDICLTGGCDMCVTPMSLAGFGNLRALSRRNHEPQLASRPFDRGRDGFVMGEGGCVFVLESAALARRRSASVYGEVAGCGASSDAHNMVMPSPDPEPAVAAMRQALADAGVAPAEVDYINAHATSTTVGDAAETRVLERVFGSSISSIPVSSTKSMTGHMLTAAAAVEALACLVAMKYGSIPPTINLDDPDPECNLCHVPNQAQPHKVRVAVSNSFGFGGSNTCLALKAV
jgi:3-oxoacyl-[acyl-carrier-protein] synthase II